MSHAKRASKRKRKSIAVPATVAAGLSLSLVGGVSAATGRPAADMLTRNTGVSHEITLGEEEISDVSLATFYVSDKESAGTFQPHRRLAMMGGCGCGCGGCTCAGFGWSGTNDTELHQSIKPARKHTHAPKRKHIPKNP